MEPNVTYELMMASDDAEERADAARDLLSWLNRGGFPPRDLTKRAAVALCLTVIREGTNNEEA